MSTILIRNSGTPGNIPSSLNTGELAINTSDGKIFYGSSGGVKEFDGGGGGTVNTGSLLTTASFNAWTGSNTSQFAGTASFVTSASYALSASQATSASYVLSSSYALSASFASTSSYVNPLVQNVIITGSINHSGSLIQTGSVSITGSTTINGLLYPNADNGEFSFIQSDGNGNLTLQYVETMYETIYNGEVTQLLKGTPVYISGSQGANAIVYRADAANAAKMPAIYIAGDNIDPGDTGRGILLGLITGVDTTGYPAGTEIYVAAGGSWTEIRPTGSAIIQTLGIVTKEGNGGQGVVLNPGPANLPNIAAGNVWVGDSNAYPTAVTTSSLSVKEAITASYANNFQVSNSLTASIVSASQFTGSLFGTASWAINALTSSQAISASYALTASYVEGGGGGSAFPYTGNAVITGSLLVSGTSNGQSGITGSLFGTASWAVNASQSISSSFATTASYANNIPPISTTTLTDFTNWTDYSSLTTLIGITLPTVKQIQYMIMGKTMFVQFDFRCISPNGSGSSTSFTIPNNASSWGGEQRGLVQGVNGTTQVPSLWKISAGTNIVELAVGNANDTNFNSWTNGAARRILGQLFINIT